MTDKPSSMLLKEFKEKIVAAINESDLPAFVLAPVLELALGEVKDIEQKQYEADKAAYEEELNNGKITETS